MQVDNGHDIDTVMSLYNLIEYIDNYSNTSGTLWQCYRDKLNDTLTGSKSFEFKVKTLDDGNIKDAEMAVPLKYFFWRTLEMPLINCETSLNRKWSSTCIINNSRGVETFAIIDTKLYVPIVTLSTKDNAELLNN